MEVYLINSYDITNIEEFKKYPRRSDRYLRNTGRKFWLLICKALLWKARVRL